MNCRRFVQQVVDDSQSEANMTYRMSMPTLVDASLYLHAILLKSKADGKKMLIINLSSVNSELPCMVAQLVQKSPEALRMCCWHRTLLVGVEAKMWLSATLVQLEVL